ADTDRFQPGANGPVPFERPAPVVAVFAGAFRSWHGAVHLASAIRELRVKGRREIGAVFIGDGPELPVVRDEARGLEGVIFTGARRSRLQLGSALPVARRRDRSGTAAYSRSRPQLMHILIATDAFPPVCGGSGWSSYELARGLRARGHRITVVQPRPNTPPRV